MEDLTIAGWHKADSDQRSTSIGNLHFHVSGNLHLALEQAEERLQNSDATEVMIDADLQDLQLTTPEEVGDLVDCQFRLYLNPADNRGHFHLVGHRAADGSLVYSNSVMVDQIG